LSLTEMAAERNLTVGTIISHMERLAAEQKINPERDLAHIKPNPVRFEKMKQALDAIYKKEKAMPLSVARELLGNTYNFDELRLTRLFIQHLPKYPALLAQG